MGLCGSLFQDQAAMIGASDLKFADWTQVFGDELLMIALLDRLTHKAHVIEFVSESYRFGGRQQRQKLG